VGTADVRKYDDYNLDGFGNAVFATRDFVEKNLRNRMSYYTAKVAGGAEGLAARTEARR
jgi:hypothetical protein